MRAAIFQPDVLQWLFGSGIGTNLGAAIVWLPIGAALGIMFSRTKGVHAQLRKLHARHDQHAATLDRIEEALKERPSG